MADKKNFWNSGFGSFVSNMLFGLPSLIGTLISSSRLTGAEREQNKFNAQQAVLQREFESEQAQRAMDFSAAQTSQQLSFQRDMANTQWQRGVQDMKAAGINPALAYNQGGAVAPSGAAASGVSGSGAAASGSGRGMPFSMSDVMQLLLLPKQSKLLDKQITETESKINKTDAETGRIQEETKWIPLMNASQLDLNAGVLEKYAKEVEGIIASTEGQKLANEWNPKLWQNELDNGRVNRQSTIVAISKMQQEIQNLIAQEGDIYAGIDLKRMQVALAAAQIGLVNANTANVSADTWSKQFDNAFRELTGYKPDQPIWNAVTSVLGDMNRGLKDSLERLSGKLKFLGKGNFLRNFRDSHVD